MAMKVRAASVSWKHIGVAEKINLFTHSYIIVDSSIHPSSIRTSRPPINIEHRDRPSRPPSMLGSRVTHSLFVCPPVHSTTFLALSRSLSHVPSLSSLFTGNGIGLPRIAVHFVIMHVLHTGNGIGLPRMTRHLSM